jgi:hypothetical protein
MAQMTWRLDDVLLERVRHEAQRQGRSMNEYVTAVLDAATNPDLAGDDAARLRERIERAGLAVAGDAPRRRPDPTQVTRARSAAGAGKPLSDLVSQGR